ncbi:MAG: Eco57I restriction-modification methylase domain-containing protein [Bdellovibrionales bacterium]
MKIDQLEFEEASSNIDRYFDVPIYFKCHGLFADPFVADHLPVNGNLASTGNKVIDSHWGADELQYEQFFNTVINTFDRFYPACKKWNEYQLEDKFIKPILEALGFQYDVQETVAHAGKGSRPDYTLFFDDKAFDSALKSKERDEDKYWHKAISVADAKQWKIDLDADGGPQNCPSSQIVRYLDATVKDWGIITNGRQWRLYYRNCQDRSMKYFEIDLERMCLSKGKHDRLRHFFYFFRNKAFQKVDGRCFLDVVLKESDSYAVRVSNSLRTKIIHQAPRLAGAIMNADPKIELMEAYKLSLYQCFRLIFVLAAESRGVLDISLNSKYHGISLRKTAFELREKWSEGEEWSPKSSDTHTRLQKLFAVLDSGSTEFGLVGFKSNAYANCDKAIFNKAELPDDVMNDLVLELACESDKEKKKLFVDYKRISPEHLGGIFESLLEFKPHLTSKKTVILEGATDRKDSGAYYTPDYVVDYLLERSIPENCETEKMRVLDPACGSGHFIVGAIRALSKKAAEAHEGENETLENLRGVVAKTSVFGIDRNEVAVALTKLSVFLTVMQKDTKLPDLDKNIKCADSLRDTSIKEFKNSFDLVIGNPPYVNTRVLSKSDKPLKEYLTESGDYKTCKGCFDLYIPFIEKSLNYFLKPDGTTSFVLPNKLMVADYADEARKLAETASHSIEVIDISHLDVFKGVGVYPHMYIFKTSKDRTDSVSFKLESAEAAVTSKDFATFKTEIINEEIRKVSGNVWSAQMKKSRKGMTTLSEICVIEGGLTGFGAQAALKALSDGKPRTPGVHVPFVVSGSISKASIAFGNVRYMKHDFSEPYMNVAHKEISKGKRSLFESEKVVIAGMTKEIRATYSSTPLAVGVGVFSIKKCNYKFQAIAAALNSLAFTYLFRLKFEAKHLAGGYLAINASQLNDADFPAEISDEDEKALVSWYKKMSSKNYKLSDRLEFERYAASIFSVSIKDIGSLEIFDTESAEVIAAFRGKAA